MIKTGLWKTCIYVFVVCTCYQNVIKTDVVHILLKVVVACYKMRTELLHKVIVNDLQLTMHIVDIFTC